MERTPESRRVGRRPEGGAAPSSPPSVAARASKAATTASAISSGRSNTSLHGEAHCRILPMLSAHRSPLREGTSCATDATASRASRGAPSVASTRRVLRCSSPVRRECCEREDWPATTAHMAATFCSASSPSSSAAAASSKYGSSRGSTVPIRRGTSAAAAPITVWTDGGPCFVNRMPVRRSRSPTDRLSRSEWSRIAVPERPARPVRPERWTYDSESCGRRYCTMRSTPSMSMPRAATSVATSTGKWPSRNFCSVVSRAFCEMSPCNGCADSGASAAETQRSSTSRLVAVKTMVRVSAPVA
mmetsp:Transcript_37663/g.118039  ORF Transcript_37663/g.118039 Transcript_37663/m.118039 type:complete len:302 (-) Transcript_37663:1163-2068(-)